MIALDILLEQLAAKILFGGEIVVEGTLGHIRHLEQLTKTKRIEALFATSIRAQLSECDLVFFLFLHSWSPYRNE